MTRQDEYCDFCDLPKAQCIHGQPAVTKPVVTSPPRPRKRSVAKPRVAGSSNKPVNRRWTPPETLKPHILYVLAESGGELEADELFRALETRVEGQLMPGDSERTPEGELRWKYAARRARLALIDEGLMTKGIPGVWQLAKGR